MFKCLCKCFGLIGCLEEKFPSKVSNSRGEEAPLGWGVEN